MDKRRFLALRTSAVKTQAEWAGLLGISPGYVGDIERGHRPVTLKIAEKLHEVTGEDTVAEYLAGRREQAA